MSLIHDALKRAKAAEKQTPSPDSPGPSFREIEPGQYARRGIGIALPVALGVVALLGLFLVWRFSHNNVRARSGEPPTQSSVADQTRAASPLAPAALASKPMPVPVPNQSIPAPAATPPADVATAPTTNSTLDSTPNVATTTIAPTEPTPPKPAPLRLQAILYHPQHPSAVVNGKTLFLGDRIGDLRLVALDKESATLAGAGKTNVLMLDQ